MVHGAVQAVAVIQPFVERNHLGVGCRTLDTESAD